MRQRDTGQWEVRVSVGLDPVSGRSISRSVTVVGDLADARRRQEELAAQAAALRLSQQQPLRTVGELLERWMSAEHNWTPSTWSGYRLAARAPASVTSTLRSYRDLWKRHIDPDLGHLRLDQLTPAVLRDWLAQKATQASVRGGMLAPNTQARISAVLRAAHNDAVRDDLLKGNPLDRVRPPRAGAAGCCPIRANGRADQDAAAEGQARRVRQMLEASR